MIDNLKTAASIVGSIVTISGFIAILIKPVRNALILWITKTARSTENNDAILRIELLLKEHLEQDAQNRQRLDKLTDSSRSLLRSEITHMYYKYTDSCEIPEYERENLIKLYSSYKGLNGNSYIDICYEEIMELSKRK